MFNKISQLRLLVYFLLLGLIPFVFVFANFLSKHSRVELGIETLREMQLAAQLREKKQATNIAVCHHYGEADHFYIDKHLETLNFLENEIEGLQKIVSNKSYAEDETIKKRLEYLTTSNSLAFSEGVVQSCSLFQETTESLVHPVEISSMDVQKILAKVDGEDIGAHKPGPNRPQLIVLDFKLNKKNITEKNEVFVLNMKLLKREFL